MVAPYLRLDSRKDSTSLRRGPSQELKKKRGTKERVIRELSKKGRQAARFQAGPEKGLKA